MLDFDHPDMTPSLRQFLAGQDLIPRRIVLSPAPLRYRRPRGLRSRGGIRRQRTN